MNIEIHNSPKLAHLVHLIGGILAATLTRLQAEGMFACRRSTCGF